MNLQLQHVVVDITGVTGMKIIRAIIQGERDPAELVKFRDDRCKKSPEVMKEALIGNYQPEHLFALTQAVELYDFYQIKAADCDQRIQQVLKELEANKEPPETSLPKPRHRTKQPNALDFDVRPVLYRILGVDLTQIHGLGPYVALKLVAECGTDMSRWPDAKHFTSWLCLAPGSKISGGKVLVLKNSSIIQPRSGSSQIGSDHNRENRYCFGRFLSTFIFPYWQGQGGNRYST